MTMDTLDEQARIAWLADHAAPIRTRVDGSDDYADLAALDPYLEGVRVVQLGEQTHGDGTCFDAKVRMVKYLRERHGFDVLGWESGFYSCQVAYEAVKAGEDVVEAFELGLFKVWTRSRQVRPLFDYVQEQASGDSPLELWGIDTQLSGYASRDQLPQDLRDRGCPKAAAVFERMLKADFAVGAEAVAAQDELEDAAGRETDAFWKRCFQSLAAECRGRQTQGEGGGGEASSRNRDLNMGANLVWLANEMYPERKVVVWIDSGHASHSFASLKMPEGQSSADYVTSGNVARQALGRELFTLHFTAAAGSAGSSDGPPQTFGVGDLRTFGTPPEGSFEYLCTKAGLTDAIIDLRPGSGAPWMAEHTTMRQGGYVDREAIWPELFDAVVFHPFMEPSSA